MKVYKLKAEHTVLHILQMKCGLNNKVPPFLPHTKEYLSILLISFPKIFSAEARFTRIRLQFSVFSVPIFSKLSDIRSF